MSQKITDSERVEKLETLLFAVVRAMLLPISLRCNKTDKELTEKTFEAIKETERTLDYDRIKALMALGENSEQTAEEQLSDNKYPCKKCENINSPLCELCSCIKSPGAKESKPKYYIPRQDAITPSLLYLKNSGALPDILIKEYLNQSLPLPFDLVNKYNKTITEEE